jgi:chitin synthase
VSDYASFLPGIFSAYRYKAMSDNTYGPGPLTIYLRGESVAGEASSTGPPVGSVQFTGDQILFREIFTKKGEKWTLRHVRSAKASLFKYTA